MFVVMFLCMLVFIYYWLFGLFVHVLLAIAFHVCLRLVVCSRGARFSAKRAGLRPPMGIHYRGVQWEWGAVDWGSTIW